MFGGMMPRGPGDLKISQMDLAGLGTRMIKSEMTGKHVMDLPRLIETARGQGVHIIAGMMSMDLMGIHGE